MPEPASQPEPNLPQGWNRKYPFSLGDLVVCKDVLNNYLEARVTVRAEIEVWIKATFRVVRVVGSWSQSGWDWGQVGCCA